MTNRKITTQQFVTEGTIDGNRLQTALDETEEFINNVPLDAVKQKYSLNYMVFTRLGSDANDVTGTIGNTIGDARFCPFFLGEVSSEYRAKGTLKDPNRTPLYHAASALSYFTPYVFTVSTFFYRPVILDTISLYMSNASSGASSPGIGDFHDFDFWDPSISYPRGAGYQRIRVLIDTDDAVSSEDRTLNSKEYALQDFQETFWSAQPHATASTMLPANSGLTSSIQLQKTLINLPFHKRSRVRFRVVLYLAEADAIRLRTGTAENMTFTIIYKEALSGG